MVLASWIPAGSADSGKFRLGATRIDVTPPQKELPKPYLADFEPIYARTIVVDNEKTRAIPATVGTATISGEYPELLTLDNGCCPDLTTHYPLHISAF